MDQIKTIQQKINKLHSSSKRRKKLEKSLILMIHVYLKANDNEFKSIVDRQYQLLENKIRFKPTDARNAIMGTHGTKYTGRIHKNGYAYLTVKKANGLSANPFAGMKHPKKFVGTIDYMGNISIKAVGFEYKLLKSLPSLYDGTINQNGFISLTTTKTEMELSNGMVIKMIGRVFQHEHLRIEFQNNKYRLIAIVKDFREKL